MYIDVTFRFWGLLLLFSFVLFVNPATPPAATDSITISVSNEEKRDRLPGGP